MITKKRTRIAIGTLGFFLPVLAIFIEFIFRLPLPAFKLPAILTPVLFLGSLILFVLAIFSTVELKVATRFGLFAGVLMLYAIQVVLLGFTLVIFTGF